MTKALVYTEVWKIVPTSTYSNKPKQLTLDIESSNTTSKTFTSIYMLNGNVLGNTMRGYWGLIHLIIDIILRPLDTIPFSTKIPAFEQLKKAFIASPWQNDSRQWLTEMWLQCALSGSFKCKARPSHCCTVPVSMGTGQYRPCSMMPWRDKESLQY